MRGLGTIINVLAIVAGGLIGLFFKSFFKPQLQRSLTAITGVAVMFVGIQGAIKDLGQGSLMMICSLVLGMLLGELLDIDGRIERFGEYLKKASRCQGDKGFVNAFVSASCTVCIGAMAIMGSINDGVLGDYTVLTAKAILDFIIIAIMTAALGKGAIFSALPVAIFQGSITLAAYFLGSFLSAAALANIAYVGSILIFCVGLNLLRSDRISVANALPALLIAAIWSFL